MAYFVISTTAAGERTSTQVERGPLPYPIAARRIAQQAVDAGATEVSIVITETGRPNRIINYPEDTR